MQQATTPINQVIGNQHLIGEFRTRPLQIWLHQEPTVGETPGIDPIKYILYPGAAITA